MRIAGTLASAAVLAATAVQAQDPVTIKIADSLPPTHPIIVEGLQPWMERVTDLSGGAVEFEHYPAQQLGKANEMLRLLQSSVVQIAYVGPSYVSDKMPLSEVAALPGLFTTSCEGTRAFNKLALDGTLAKAEMEPNGVKVLFTSALPAYQIFTTSQPLESLDDLRGLKLRSGGGANDLTLQALGAAPVRVPAPEIMEVLQRGTVDGNHGPYTSQTTYGFAEVEKYATEGAALGSFITSYMIDLDVWNDLDPGIQEAINVASAETNEKLCGVLQADEIRSMEVMEQSGIRILRMTPEMDARIAEISAGVQDEWAEGMESRGLAGSATLEEFRSAVAGSGS